jgi:UPF0755 protein
MRRTALTRLLVAGALAVGLALAWVWAGTGPLQSDTTVVIPKGASVALAANKLADAGVIRDARLFRLGARLLGGAKPIQAGEYAFPATISMAKALQVLQSGSVILHKITIAEGLSAVQVVDALMAEPLLEGPVDVPEEGSLLPETYTFTRGETRADVLERMQLAMTTALEALWPERAANLPISTPEEALILASIIEKETGKASEYRLVAGVYTNRLRQGMRLQADPTVIYPITKGKPLGRRIRQSELDAINDYNTYTRDGLPAGPIAMPGRQALAAALNPAKTDAIFFVADGSGGHVFANTYAEHRRNVAGWRAHRAATGL